MTQEYVLAIARDAVITTLTVSAPLLIISLVVGLGISIFQATTQIQEQTLTFVPKIVAIFASILIFGNWMLNILISITTKLFSQMSTLGL
ncbi:MAG: flagellar biosynthesis protein FliQ [Firmicutes bacterium]|nr:flagellar biosynthesis protein FliQ [Bacillota bacterium]